MTDAFHPLVTPLTTYTYTAGSSEADTVSASDEQRLPPGGFSLRHGFPNWYQRAPHLATPEARSPSAQPTDRLTRSEGEQSLSTDFSTAEQRVPGLALVAPVGSQTRLSRSRANTPIPEVLEYLRATFSDESVLDALPLKAAANPGVSCELSRSSHSFCLLWAARPGMHGKRIEA